MNPIAIRLLSQQLICPQFDTPQKVVSHFGAMQAQDYRMGKMGCDDAYSQTFFLRIQECIR
jgi:hypothetical protein